MAGFPDLRSVVRRFESPATRRRFAAHEVDASGLRMRGGFTDTAIRAAIWPANGSVGRPPEGQQEADAVEGVARTELRAADTEAGTTADVVIVGGAAYEIDSSQPWPRGASRTTQFWHFRATRVVLELDYPAAMSAGPAIEVEA